MDKIKIVIDSKYNNLTIKELLKSFYVGKPKIEEIRNSKNVYLNGNIVNIESKLAIGDELEFYFEEERNFKSWNRQLNVLYEDENILIVNKPTGILIHPDNDSNNNTLVNMVANYYEMNEINREIRYIHRIDLETSGIVVFAKDFLSFAKLNHQIETHEVKREYLALCDGIFKAKKETINLPIGRDRHVSNKYRVSIGSNLAKESITYYEVVKQYKDYALIKCLLETGRTHQIRVHMSHIKHPLLGDKLYGGSNKTKRVALHSYHVNLVNPITNNEIDVICNLPNDLKIKEN